MRKISKDGVPSGALHKGHAIHLSVSDLGKRDTEGGTNVDAARLEAGEAPLVASVAPVPSTP
jgi:hypothetical protein